MKQFIHKSIAICMAFVVLMTTMSFTVDMHYCGNTMVDYSFFHNASTCKMEKAILTASCGSPEVKKKSCCSDEQLIIQGQDDLKNKFLLHGLYILISIFLKQQHLKRFLYLITSRPTSSSMCKCGTRLFLFDLLDSIKCALR
jgi:hypothetical protein